MEKIYNKSGTALLIDFVNTHYNNGESFTKTDVLTWFNKQYPKLKKSAITTYLIKLSTNDKSRIHYGVHSNGNDDILYKINAHTYRKYDGINDPMPIYNTGNSNRNKCSNIMANYQKNLDALTRNIHCFMNKVTEVEKGFGGPAMYFHQEALKEIRNDFLGYRHLEMMYAVLPAWGMHRMGETATKIVDYNTFCKRILSQKDTLLNLKDRSYNDIAIDDLTDLLVNKLRVTNADSHLVSSSKVLHHIIPHLICPIDRQYSIRFLTQKPEQFTCISKEKIKYSSVNYKNNDEIIYAEIFLKGMHSFIQKHKTTIYDYIDKRKESNQNLNMSPTKVFDNLLVAFVQTVKKTKENDRHVR